MNVPRSSRVTVGAPKMRLLALFFPADRPLPMLRARRKGALKSSSKGSTVKAWLALRGLGPSLAVSHARSALWVDGDVA
jgi:hypothetical protein